MVIETIIIQKWTHAKEQNSNTAKRCTLVIYQNQRLTNYVQMLDRNTKPNNFLNLSNAAKIWVQHCQFALVASNSWREVV